MTDPLGLLEVFLGPGDLYFGDQFTRIRTLLGSCVAITLWHPRALIGGMCHYMMPTRSHPGVQGPFPDPLHSHPAGEQVHHLPGRGHRHGLDHEPGPAHGSGSGSGHGPDHGYELSGKYADEALLILLHEIEATSTSPHDYEVKMFGGGNQFPGQSPAVDVAARNIDAGLHLLAEHGLTLTSMHLGGTGHRQVILDVWSGDVWVRHSERVHDGRVEEMAWP